MLTNTQKENNNTHQDMLSNPTFLGDIKNMTNEEIDSILEKYKGYERITIDIFSEKIKILKKTDQESGKKYEEELVLEYLKKVEILWNDEEGKIFRDESWEKQELPTSGKNYRLFYIHPEGYAIEDMQGNQFIDETIKKEIDLEVKNFNGIELDVIDLDEIEVEEGNVGPNIMDELLQENGDDTSTLGNEFDDILYKGKKNK